MIEERLSESGQPRLILYHRNFCGFCRRVRKVMAQMGIEIEQRNIWDDRRYKQELVEATGRTIVPVLRLIADDGRSEWIPESLDIMHYLRTRSP